MDILSQSEGIKILARLICERNVIPVFGAGFTMNNRAYKGQVPDGTHATMMMKKLLLENCSKIKDADIKDMDFNETSEMFIDLVPKEIRTEFFRDYFTEVQLGISQKELLQFNWPYAYTLNIDDGIENTNLFKPVLPYKNLNAPNTSIKLLYKLHGDAFSEVTYKTEENIVFSHKQYMKSINAKENQDFLHNLKADYSTSNMLFIGCSLLNEPDLKYVYSIAEHSSDTLKIILRDKAPSFREEIGLKNDYGINTVIIVEDYPYFYQELIKEVRRKITENNLQNYRFKNPVVVAKESKEDTINYLFGNPIFDESNNQFYKSGIHIIRNCVEEIEQQLKETNCVIIKGRRFSGKTYVILSLCERQKKSSIYYFPSTSLVDEQLVYLLLNNEHDSWFIFDSNSISNGCYKLLANSYELLMKNSNKLIIGINSNDNFIMESLQARLVELPNIFDGKELEQNYEKADKYGLIKRHPKNTNMDYLETISQRQKIKVAVLNHYPNRLSFSEQIMILLLAASDKILMSDVMALGISSSDVSELKKKFPVIIEEVPVDINERANYSATKLVHNSKVVLMKLLDGIDKEDIIKCIVHIVERVKDDRTRYRIYIDIILFDTLNQLFGGKRGAGNLIFEVYERLEEYLSDSLHYWLQRSKSIYRLKSNDLAKLKEAYSYSIKVYFDGGHAIKSKAALTSSLICCLIYGLETDKDEKQYYLEQAIELGDDAVNSDYYRFNISYLNNELKPRKRLNSYELLMNTCNECIEYYCEPNILGKAKRLVGVLKNMEEQFSREHKIHPRGI